MMKIFGLVGGLLLLASCAHQQLPVPAPVTVNNNHQITGTAPPIVDGL